MTDKRVRRLQSTWDHTDRPLISSLKTSKPDRRGRIPFLRQVRGEVTTYWIGASSGAIAADIFLFNVAIHQHNIVMQWILAVVIAVIFTIAALVQWRFRVLFRPIALLHAEMGRLAQGDFTDRQLTSRGRSDLASVVIALSDAKTSIRQILEHLQETSNGLAESAEALTSGAGDAKLASEQTTALIERIAGGVEQQQVVTSDTERAMERTVASVSTIETLSNQASQTSDKIRLEAESGKRQVTETRSRMRDIEQQVQRMTSQSDDVALQATQVETIVQVLDEIVDGTKMLALNAGIEAARADEHGRGFAVVAREVQQLAERAGHESERIKGVVKQIGTEAQQLVVRMKTVSKTVDDGAGAVESTEKMFMSIAETLVEQEAGSRKIQTCATDIGVQAEAVSRQMA